VRKSLDKSMKSVYNSIEWKNRDIVRKTRGKTGKKLKEEETAVSVALSKEEPRKVREAL
jgi:hypothetical protein